MWIKRIIQLLILIAVLFFSWTSLYPIFGAIQLDKALVAEKMGDTQSAVDALNKAINWYPYFYQTRIGRANILSRQGIQKFSPHKVPNFAKEFFLLKQNKEILNYYYPLKSYELEFAINELKEALKLFLAPKIYQNLGFNLEMLQRWDEALEAYLKAYEYDPSLTDLEARIAVVMLNLGDIELIKGNVSKAKGIYLAALNKLSEKKENNFPQNLILISRKSILFCPLFYNWKDLYAHLAICYFLEGNYNKAKEYLDQALKENNYNGFAWYLKGCIEFNSENFQRAFDCFSNASCLSDFNFREFQLDLLEYYLKLVEKIDNWEIYYYLAKTKYALKQVNEAEEFIKKAMAKNKISELYYQGCLIYKAKGDFKKAGEMCSKALGLSKLHLDAKEELDRLKR